MKNIDLRLLAVISELHRTGSVSQTAENLALSQSAVSMSLARLRKHFNDPLFVRTSRGMEATPYAAGLITELKKAADILEAALDHHTTFDPNTSDRMFHVCSTDIAQFTILPALAAKLKAVAPNVRIDLRNLSEDTPHLLESGEADIAIGLIPQMGAGFCQQKLFTGQFLCAMRADHPRVKNTLTVDQYMSESHLTVTMLGTGYQSIERSLESQKIRRHIGMRVPSFLGVGAIITATDYLVIVPQRYGRILAEGRNVKLIPLPFTVPGYTVTQNWHERYSQDPAQQWFRNLVLNTFKDGMKPVIVRDTHKARNA